MGVSARLQISKLKDVIGVLNEKFPEVSRPVSRYDEKIQTIYIKKYARSIYLGGGNVKAIKTHDLPIDNWELYDKENLLNSNISKFMSKAKAKKGKTLNRFIEIVLKKPKQVCAIGLRSANNFPHLDP